MQDNSKNCGLLSHQFFFLISKRMLHTPGSLSHDQLPLVLLPLMTSESASSVTDIWLSFEGLAFPAVLNFNQYSLSQFIGNFSRHSPKPRMTQYSFYLHFHSIINTNNQVLTTYKLG